MPNRDADEEECAAPDQGERHQDCPVALVHLNADHGLAVDVGRAGGVRAIALELGRKGRFHGRRYSREAINSANKCPHRSDKLCLCVHINVIARAARDAAIQTNARLLRYARNDGATRMAGMNGKRTLSLFSNIKWMGRTHEHRALANGDA
jgi:hypothetical protein